MTKLHRIPSPSRSTSTAKTVICRSTRAPRCSTACARTSIFPAPRRAATYGQCGACTVHVNGRRVNSCLSFAAMHAGRSASPPSKGLGSPDKLHPMQAAFVEHDAYQCGYCTSGQIMSAVAAVREPCGPSDEDVKHAMYGNICPTAAHTRTSSPQCSRPASSSDHFTAAFGAAL